MTIETQEAEITPTEAVAPKFRLWFRKNKRAPWQIAFEGETEAALTARISEWPCSGDWLTLPAEMDANESRSVKQ